MARVKNNPDVMAIANIGGGVAISKHRNDLRMVEILDIFQKHIEGRTMRQIADERKEKTTNNVYKAITQARQYYLDILTEAGKTYFAEVWAKYDWVYEQAVEQWEITRDPAYLKEMRACLEAYRKMMSLDHAPKAAVNEEGKAMPDKLILVMNTSEYEKREAEFQTQRAMLADPDVIDGAVVAENDELGENGE